MNDQIKTREQLIEELQELRRQVTELQGPESRSPRAEEVLQAGAMQRACFNHIADPIFIFDQETKLILDCNQAMLDRYGYTLAELRRMTPHQLHPLDELDIVDRNIDDRNDTSAHQYTHITKHRMRLQVEVLTNEAEYEGRAAWISVIRDITQRKQAESEIVKLNSELTALNDIGQALISTLDLQETLTVVTGHLIRLMGVRAASVALIDEKQNELQFAAASGEGADFIRGVRIKMGQGIAGWVAQHGEPLMVPDVAQDARWFDAFDQPSGLTTRSILCVPLQSKGQSIGAIEVMNKEGGTFEQEDVQLLTSLAVLAAAAIENARFYDQAQREIVERERTGQALRESEERLNTLLNNVPTGIVLIDAETHVIVDANPLATEMVGVPREQIVGSVCHRYICPADQGGCPITDLEQTVDHSERVLLTADGKRVSILKTVVPVMLDGRQHLLESFVDITKRKQIEDALRESEEKYRAILENIEEGYFEVDLAGNFVFFNDALCRIIEYPADEMMGMNYRQHMSEESIEEVFQSFNAVYKTGEPDTVLDLDITAKSGTQKLIETSVSLVRDITGESVGFRGVVRDVTMRRQAEIERKRLLAALEHRSTQLQTAAEVSRTVSSILDPEALASQVVDLVSERFDLYYAGLFLVDQTGEWTRDDLGRLEPGKWAVLRAGTGKAGRHLLAQGHKLEVGGASMIGRCITNKRARTILDVDEGAMRFNDPYLSKARSKLALPLISRGESIGALTIQSEQESAFSEQDVAILQTMADQMANAISNARLYDQAHREINERKRAEEQAHRRTAQATLVYEVGRRVSGELELEALLSEIVTASRDAFDYDGVMLFLLDEERNNLTLQSIVGVYSDVFSGGLSLAVGEGMIGRAAATAEPQISGDVSENPYYVQKASEQTISELAVPIKSGQTVIGVLDLQSNKVNAFDETDVLVMETMADQIAVAIRNARLFEAVQTSEERNRSVVENANEAIFVAQAGMLKFVNPQATIIIGYSEEELTALPFTEFLHPDDREMVVERHLARLKGAQDIPQTYPFRIIDKDGNVKWVELNAVLIDWDGKPATLNFMADITERRRAAEITRRAEQRYRAVAESAVTGIAIVDPKETLTFVNPAFANMLGYTQEELAGMNISLLTIPEEFARYQEQTQARERDGTHSYYETTLLRKDEDTLNILVSGSPLTAADGSFQGTIAVIVDVTERKRAVEALQEALAELEQYTYNLERQTAQLQVGAEVAREAAAILDVQQLLDTAVHLISKRFGFYHAGAFLIDELREYAVMRAASSDGGKRMLSQGHKLPLGKVGIVGYVAATGESRVALDVGMDDMHFAHSDLPDTRSEMGLPLNVRGRTIGVLDVQAPDADAFTDNDVTAMQTLADQLAVAIDNARLVERTETQLRELSLLYGEYSSSAWADLTSSEDAMRYVYDRIDVVSVDELSSPALNMALARGKTTTIVEPEKAPGAGGEKTLATPLKLHDRIIGGLGIQEEDSSRRWSPNEIALVEAVSDQVSLALENAQHFAETQKTAQQMQILNELARSLATRLTTQEVLAETYMGASRLLNTMNFFIAFHHPQNNTITFPLAVENDQSVEWRSRPVGDGLTEYVMRTKQPLLIRSNVHEWLENEGIESIGMTSRSWLGAPLMVGERVLGVMAVQSESNNVYDERDRNLLTGIANQTAIALQNAHLFRETESALAETEVLYSVSETISQLEGLEETFQSLAYILTGQLNYASAWLAQVDKRTRTLNGIAGVGIDEHWIKVKIPLEDELRDPAVQAVLTHSPIVINDVANDERTADMSEEARAFFSRLLEVPILVGIEAGGIIAVSRSADMPEIIKRDIEVLQVVADQAAVALQNIRLLEETRRRAEQERRIYEITSKIRRSSNITTILQTAVEELGQALHTDRALVRLMVKPRETQDT